MRFTRTSFLTVMEMISVTGYSAQQKLSGKGLKIQRVS